MSTDSDITMLLFFGTEKFGKNAWARLPVLQRGMKCMNLVGSNSETSWRQKTKNWIHAGKSMVQNWWIQRSDNVHSAENQSFVAFSQCYEFVLGVGAVLLAVVGCSFFFFFGHYLTTHFSRSVMDLVCESFNRVGLGEIKIFQIQWKCAFGFIHYEWWQIPGHQRSKYVNHWVGCSINGHSANVWNRFSD